MIARFAHAFPYAMPLAGLAGGALVGLAAAIMLLGLGRIAGVSGLAARAVGLADRGPSRAVAIAFVVGLPLGASIIAWLTGSVVVHFPDKLAPLLAGGVLVGFGTRLGSGCTSGHGICGLSRLSLRSIVATVLCMASGFATVAVLRWAHLL